MNGDDVLGAERVRLRHKRELAALDQALLEQRLRTDSNLRARVAAMVLLLATNASWLWAWTFWR